MNTPSAYCCDVCGEAYLTKNAAYKCNQLPKEELKFSTGDQVIVDACKSTQQTGTVVGIKYVAGFSGGKHFASYTIELVDKSLVLRNARSLKTYTPMRVLLEPEDVPPLSAIRRKGQTDEYGKPQYWHWRLVSYVTGIGPVCADRGYNWQELSTDYEINRSLSLGKWDANAWEPCKKLKQ